MNERENKIKNGQFYTINNPFHLNIFLKWISFFIQESNIIFLEPFAGSGNIPKMLRELGFNNDWKCYDIEPAESEYMIEQRNTIENFPTGYKVVITNPPYLYKSSASRKGIDCSEWKYDNLYKICIEEMIINAEYIAVIIPESFLTSLLFLNRLYAIISLTNPLFSDTEYPVCLALFIPESKKKELKIRNDFFLYSQDQYLGTYKELSALSVFQEKHQIDWKMNDRTGSIGIRCIDNTRTASIEFVKGSIIEESQIKSSSRSITRVSGLPKGIDLGDFIKRCNEILYKYRRNTRDIFLTSFKGLREDGMYRRRLDFKTARKILNTAVSTFY